MPLPLQQLLDHFDDATHRRLDEAVNAEAASQDFPELLTRRDYAALLHHIIAHSNGDMNPKFKDLAEANALIKLHEELCNILSSAWKEKSYRKIRNLAILKKKTEKTVVTSKARTLEEEQELHQRLSLSFEAQYRGMAVEGFYEYLTKNERLFKSARKPSFYARFCSIVQSSGTGKSRMMTELSKKDVVVIYMNLRKEKDKLGFPARDSIPSKILTNFPSSAEDYRVVCCAFFIALFDTIKEYLQTKKTRSGKKDVMSWVARMCDMSDPPRDDTRMQFFQKLGDRYNKVHGPHIDALARHKEETRNNPPAPRKDETDDETLDSDTDVNETANKLQEITLSGDYFNSDNKLPSAPLSQTFSSDPPNKKPSSGPPNLSWRMNDAYREMARCLEELLVDNSDRPKLLIGVDEAHPLTPVHTADNDEAYRPADVFCRVVNQYSNPRRENHAVWVAFASTTSKVADFSPPNEKHNSDRVAIRGRRLFQPYTQLGWDQSASGLGDTRVENVAQLGHVTGFGRPLWQSLRTVTTDPNDMLDLASSKLCGGDEFDASSTSHVLAVFGQRFCVDIALGHPQSVEHLENGVASHLRVCLGTTLDRNWRFTAYPSEPLLSCVAAHDLHEKPEDLKSALVTLLKTVNSGMINMGQRGELASRLLWLLAKDLFVRTEGKNVVTKTLSWDDDLTDCQMIPVVDWLEFIFGPRIWDKENTQTSFARKIFKDAYLNFSHWVSMEENIAGSREEKSIGLYEWTLRHWQRTSAVQCCHQQPLVDKAIPIYFRGDAPAKSRMSHIFISDKTGKSQSSEGDLAAITRRHESIRGDEDVSNSLPYIAILADLGRATNFSATFPERDIEDRCLRIYAAGVDTTTYPFLAKYPALMVTLQDLVHLQQMPETETPYVRHLEGQMKFGSTSAAKNMEWEHGQTIPKL